MCKKIYILSTYSRQRKVLSDDSFIMDCDEGEILQHQALEVHEPDENFNPASMPQNGEEYLTHMVYERKRCPAVMFQPPNKTLKNVDDQAMSNYCNSIDKGLPTQTADRSLFPTDEWKTTQTNSFLRIRSKVLVIRQNFTEQNYDNGVKLPPNNEMNVWMKFCETNPPKLSTVLRLNQRTLEQLLGMLSNRLNTGNKTEPVDATLNNGPSTSTARLSIRTDLTGSEDWLGYWLYAVLVCLHLPLEPQVHSTLRDIARVCIHLRNELKTQQVDKALPYNLFILLVARIFEQFDFLPYI